MPGSVRENDEDVRQFVWDYGVKTVLDVGPGRGTYAKILADMDVSLHAIEIWQPYVGRYRLNQLYEDVTVADIRQVTDFGYDLVIFGDVLEHMPHEDALAVWKCASQSARFGLISVPIIHYPQGESHGNPHEVHVQEHLTPEHIREHYGPFILDKCYSVTGTFIREFR